MNTLRFVYLIIVGVFCLLSPWAYGCINGMNYCNNRFSGSVISKYCGGRELPRSMTRNFHEDSSWKLECNATSDHFQRLPQKYDFNKWYDANERHPEEAFQYRRTLPEIAWTGQIPYQTVESWEWEECSSDTNAYKCGTNRVCHSERRQSCTSDSKGKQSCRNWTEEVCTDVACSCYYDHTRSESLHCSNEEMKFSAHMDRPSDIEWNLTKFPMDAVFLPNKYDLLPGEFEDIQIFNSSQVGQTLTPKVEYGNAWNKYHADIQGSGVNASCRMNHPTEINVKVVTEGRDRTRASPNPFTIAQDRDGKISPIKSWDETNTDGKVQKLKPRSLILMDSAAAVTQAIAEQSRRTADRENLKKELGQDANSDGQSLSTALAESKSGKAQDQSSAKGFFKNTQVRIQLKKLNKWWWKDMPTLNKNYSDDGASIVPNVNAFGHNQDLANADMWVLDLAGDQPGALNDFYRNQKLIPNRKYSFMISVYQKGVPFYQKDCSTEKIGWRCNSFVRAVGLGIGENDYYSKPLEIPFSTDEGTDERPWLMGFDWPDVNQGIPYIKWLTNPELLFEKWASEKPSQNTH